MSKFDEIKLVPIRIFNLKWLNILQILVEICAIYNKHNIDLLVQLSQQFLN